MSETLSYIDSYFKGELEDAQKTAFHARCDTDRSFAEEVAFYVQARARLEMEADVKMREGFDNLYMQRRKSQKSAVRILMATLSAVAACLIIIAGWWWLGGASVKQLADRYVQENFREFSPSMGVGQDNLEKAKDAFNHGQFLQAEDLLKNVLSQDPQNSVARESLGIAYLRNGKYDDALEEFQLLSQQANLHVNYGRFFMAVTLIERNGGGDLDRAKTILDDVVKNNLSGSDEARQWLKKF